MNDRGQHQAFETAVEIYDRGSNQGAIRAHNERVVLTILRRCGPMAKAEIARATGLSAQTVSVIMRKLEGEGLLARGEPVRGRVGQPSVPIRLDANGVLFLGLKVGRRSVELVLTDFLGAILQREITTHPFPTPKATVAFAVDQINALLDGLSADQRARVGGLGIGIPFFLWNWAKLLGVPEREMADWRHVDIRAEIAQAFDFPVYLENDASAACGAELVFGPQDGPRDFLYFYLGYFIGGGMVLNGKLFTGRGNAAALGPLPVPDGAGGVHQLLDVASLRVLETRLQAADVPTARMWESPQAWNLDGPVLETWLEQAGDALAHATAAVCSVIDFEQVRVDGWMPQDLRDALVAHTRTAMGRLNMTGLLVPDVRPGSAGADARVLGAASLPLSHRFLLE